MQCFASKVEMLASNVDRVGALPGCRLIILPVRVVVCPGGDRAALHWDAPRDLQPAEEAVQVWGALDVPVGSRRGVRLDPPEPAEEQEHVTRRDALLAQVALRRP